MSSLCLAGLRPSYRRLRAAPDPLRLFDRLYGSDAHGFLYESLEARGGRGRFSFLGGRPLAIFRSRNGRSVVDGPDGRSESEGPTLGALRAFVRCGADALPVATFPGGAVGYLGYDVVRELAPVRGNAADDLGVPDAYFIIPAEVLIVDHLDEVLHVLLYDVARPNQRADEIGAHAIEVGGVVSPEVADVDRPGQPVPFRSNLTPKQFAGAVTRAKRYIYEGDIFQVVLSQRFEFPARSSAFQLYRRLRSTNPSPYMYYLNLDGLHLAGSSPEILVKLTGSRVVSRPLAGTRPRGADVDEDERLARGLLADDKERAEHVMLVDLARNDLGRVCRVGSIGLGEYLAIERLSRVMHLVSHVEGKLRSDRDAFDLFAATFPAGTVSGAPKVRAMQIIDELEPARRGPYAGGIGYFSFLGDMDMCIAIRTLVLHAGRGYLQVGAGIVADSKPEREYQETLNKARGLLSAVQLVGGDLLPPPGPRS